ncbi:MAG TPA: hypothetical protein VJ276_07670 [Thermoanaerobaculia bacterium]|nr:hypothetical protein [Thermoanaerobaculia bacterium]
MSRLLVLPFVLLSLASSASAQFPQLEVRPPHPTAGQPVTVVVGYLCPELKLRRVNGHIIELETVSAICLSANIPGQQSFNVGPLAAGTYEVRIVDQENFLLGTFVVGEAVADVPALDPRGMWLLALAILALGIYGIGRATA